MKVLAGFAFIVLLLEFQSFAFCDDNVVRGNYEIGRCIEGDSLLETISARKPPANRILGLIPRVVKKTVYISSGISTKEGITYLRIVQQDEPLFKANRADVTVVSGGIGEKEMALKLESQRGYGFNYKVYVYGL